MEQSRNADRRRRRRVVRSAVVAGALVSVLALALGNPMDPHGKAGRCAACHGGPAPEGLTPPTGRRFDAVTVSYPLRASQETAACGLCHDVTREQIHPIDVSPSFPVPSHFPLDAGGYLVCSSCHDPHRALQGPHTPGKRHRGDVLPVLPRRHRQRPAGVAHRGVGVRSRGPNEGGVPRLGAGRPRERKMPRLP